MLLCKGGYESEDYIEINEFRICFVYLRAYFECWHMFDQIDGSSSADPTDDRRIDLAEFKKSTPSLRSWGTKIDDPAVTFAEIDKNGGGFILFEEFSNWALEKVRGMSCFHLEHLLTLLLSSAPSARDLQPLH